MKTRSLARRRDDPAADRSLDRAIDRKWLPMVSRAQDHVKDVQTSAAGLVPFADRTVRDWYNIEVIKAHAGERRAAKVADGVEKTLNVVVVQTRIDDAGEWEKMAAATDRKVIEGHEISAKEILGGAGTVGELQEELRSDLPSGGEGE